MRSWPSYRRPQRNRQKPEVKRAFIQIHSDEFKIPAMSRVPGVSRSGFYRFRQRAGSLRLILDLPDQGGNGDDRLDVAGPEDAVTKAAA